MTAEAWLERVVERAVAVQQIPAPTFAKSGAGSIGPPVVCG